MTSARGKFGPVSRCTEPRFERESFRRSAKSDRSMKATATRRLNFLALLSIEAFLVALMVQRCAPAEATAPTGCAGRAALFAGSRAHELRRAEWERRGIAGVEGAAHVLPAESPICRVLSRGDVVPATTRSWIGERVGDGHDLARRWIRSRRAR